VFKEAAVDTQVVVFRNDKPNGKQQISIEIVDKKNDKKQHTIGQQSWIDRDGDPVNIFLRLRQQGQ
jgi:hypothetical protein